MYNIVHIDEKWFYLTTESERIYLLPIENLPHRQVHNKNSITKVMFLVAVARPQFNSAGQISFDGKLEYFHLLPKNQP